MATANGPDLTTAVNAVERLMDDTCEIRFDAEGTTDDVLDEETGKLVRRAGDATLLYSGKCKIAPWGQDQPRVRTTDDLEQRPRWYRLGLPIDETAPPRGAVVTMTSTRRDPWLVGKELVVKENIGSTFAVSRKVMVELVQ